MKLNVTFSHATLQTLLTTLVAMLVLHSSLCSGLFLAPLSLSLPSLSCPPFPPLRRPPSEVEQKLAEERAAKMRVENRMLELEKHSSMLDCDYKQSLQKLDELRRHKDRLTEEVCIGACGCKCLLLGARFVFLCWLVHACVCEREMEN